LSGEKDPVTDGLKCHQVRVASPGNVTKGDTAPIGPAGMEDGKNIRASPSTRRRPVNKCLGHDVAPLANAALKRSQLAVLEHPWSLTLQSLK